MEFSDGNSGSKKHGYLSMLMTDFQLDHGAVALDPGQLPDPHMEHGGCQ